MANNNRVITKTIGDLMQDFFGSTSLPFFKDEHGYQNLSSTFPPVNIGENKTGFNLEVVAPGVPKDMIRIDINDKVLTVSYEVEKKQTEGTETKSEDETNWLRKEYKHRSFKRSFTLPETIDLEQINAQMEHGILTITLPKKEIAIFKNKTISIN